MADGDCNGGGDAVSAALDVYELAVSMTCALDYQERDLKLEVQRTPSGDWLAAVCDEDGATVAGTLGQGTTGTAALAALISGLSARLEARRLSDHVLVAGAAAWLRTVKR